MIAHWLQLATRNWWRKPGRSLTTIVAIAIGSMLVVAVMTCYASARSAIDAYLGAALGRTDVHVEMKGRSDNLLPEELVAELRQLPQQRLVVPRLKRLMSIGGPPNFGQIVRQTASGPVAEATDGGIPLGYRVTVEVVGVAEGEWQIRPLPVADGGRLIQPGEVRALICEDDLADDFRLRPGHRIILYGEDGPDQAFDLVGITKRPRMGRMTRPTVFVPLADLQRACGRPGEISTIDLLARDGQIEALREAVAGVTKAYRERLGGRLKAAEGPREAARQKLLARESELAADGKAGQFQADRDWRRLRADLDRAERDYEQLRSQFFSAANIEVTTRDAKVSKVNENLGLLNRVLQLTACVALVAATFIIFSTINMGVIERTTQLGVMRCLGLTRLQIAGLVFAEALPLGLIGIMIGVPGGVGVAYLAVNFDQVLKSSGLQPHLESLLKAVGMQVTVTGMQPVFGQFTVHWGGVALAAAGGLVATFLAALLPSISASRVSPQEASHPLAKPVNTRWLWIAFVLGAAVLAAQAVLLRTLRSDLAVQFQLYAGVLMLIVAVALMTPGLLAVLMRLLARPVGWVLGLHPGLIIEQFGRTHWRSTGIICSVMVGLALMVNLRVNVESVMSVLVLPKKFPSAMAWCWEPPTIAHVEKLRGSGPQRSTVFGIADLTAMGTTEAEILGIEKATMWNILTQSRPRAHVVAADADQWEQIIAVDFVQGSFETAKPRLKDGTGALVTREFMQAYNKQVGDELRLRRPAGVDQTGVALMGGWASGDRKPTDAQTVRAADEREAVYKIVGVVTSPAVEVVGDFFDNRSAIMERAIGGVIIGREAGLRDFGLYYAPMLLFNFDYKSLGPNPSSLAKVALEDRAFAALKTALAKNNVFPLNAARAKDVLEHDVRMVFRWLTIAAAVALGSAALGSANVMLANVVSRIRQFAVLRAVGTTRGQVIRLVFGEALVLGMVGSVLGCAVGFYLALSTHYLSKNLVGFSPSLAVPWTELAWAVGATLLACLLAAVTPARLAARTNIIDGLRV